jgi:hypothetical protein
MLAHWRALLASRCLKAFAPGITCRILPRCMCSEPRQLFWSSSYACQGRGHGARAAALHRHHAKRAVARPSAPRQRTCWVPRWPLSMPAARRAPPSAASPSPRPRQGAPAPRLSPPTAAGARAPRQKPSASGPWPAAPPAGQAIVGIRVPCMAVKTGSKHPFFWHRLHPVHFSGRRAPGLDWTASQCVAQRR